MQVFLDNYLRKKGLSEEQTREWRKELEERLRIGGQAKLAELEAKPRHFHLDGDEVWTRLEQLLEGAFAEFSIAFASEDGNVTVRMYRRAAEVCISIATDRPYELDRFLSREGLYEFRAMGFRVEAGAASKTVSALEEAEAYQILTILARIIYDVFRLPGNTHGELRH